MSDSIGLDPAKLGTRGIRPAAIIGNCEHAERTLSATWMSSFTSGTSVEQIERFYARNLPLSPELTKNLPSFVTAGKSGFVLPN
jgi:hypothetical protein